MSRSTILWTALAIMVITAFWCASGRFTKMERMADVDVWNRADREYRTNEIRGAFAAMVDMRDKLYDMEASGHNQLSYPRCQAIVNGRLFVMSEVLGDTNLASKYFRESVKYYTEERIAHKLPSKHYLQDDIRENIKNEDGGGAVRWRQQGKN